MDASRNISGNIHSCHLTNLYASSFWGTHHLVGSTSFIGDSLEVLQPFLHLSKKECIFSCMGSILRDSFIFSCRTCLVCLLPVPLFGWARCCFKDDRGSFVRGDGSEYQYVFSYCDGFGSCRIDLFLGDVPNGIFPASLCLDAPALFTHALDFCHW